MSKYDVVLNIKLDPELKSSIEKLAEEYDVTASSLVRSILKQYFNKVNNLNEKQAYYYDHLLQEIINNKDQINDVEFQSNFGKQPVVKIVKVEESEQHKRLEARDQQFKDSINKIDFTLYSDNNSDLGIGTGDIEKAKEIIANTKKKKNSDLIKL